jgi:replicative DNA helicase
MTGLTNHEAEWRIIEAALHDNACLDGLDIEIGDIDDGLHRAIFGVAQRQINQGLRADVDSVAAGLREGGNQAAATAALKLEPWTAGNVAYYAGLIKECSRKRKLVTMLRAAEESLRDRTKTSSDIIGEIESELTALDGTTQTGIRTIGEILIPTVQLLEERAKNHGAPSGVVTGYPALDRTTGGFQPGQLIIIAARPSVGKTALALSMAMNQAEKGIPVGFISAEMQGEQLCVRALGGKGHVNTMSILNGWYGPKDFPRIIEAGEAIQGMRIYIDDTPNVAMATMLSRARKMKRLGARIVYVDYLTLLRHGDAKMPRHERVGEISKMLKGLARELSIPIVALSQVGRQAADCPPSLADLRQSGEIEEDADVVILLHRATSDDSGENRDQIVEVNVAKNRTGPTEIFTLTFLREFVRFEPRAVSA